MEIRGFALKLYLGAANEKGEIQDATMTPARGTLPSLGGQRRPRRGNNLNAEK